MQNEKAVAKVEETQLTQTPAQMIITAVGKGADLAQLKGLLDLQKEWEANEAKKAYHVAMAAFKANAPEIDKDRTVAYGQTKYKHASLANVTKKIGVELSKHGLSASWIPKQNGTISVTTRITHVMGHSEEATLSAPSDTSGAKNAIQAIGSTISYLERYGLLALTGLATFEQDDDGQDNTVEYISDKQKGQLVDLLAESGVSEGKFLSYMKVESLDKITTVDFKKGVVALEGAIAKKAGKK